MTSNGTTPEGASQSCPDLDAVNAVLDREASEEEAVALRRHVAGCESCRERFGALFEVASLAPAIARGRRVSWPRPLLAAAALIVAAALVVLLRPREGAAPDVATLPKGATSSSLAPPRLVASRRVVTEIVVDAAGVRASIRRVGDGAPASIDFEKRRSGGVNVGWSSLAASSHGAQEPLVPPMEKPR